MNSAKDRTSKRFRRDHYTMSTAEQKQKSKTIAECYVKTRSRSKQKGPGNDEAAAFNLFNGVDVIDDDRVNDRLREAVGSGHHYMQFGAVDAQHAAASHPEENKTA